MPDPILSLQDIVKTFSAGSERLRILDGISLDLVPGQIVAIYGPSGSGKSTLLRAAAGDLALDAGQVRLRGKPIVAITQARPPYWRPGRRLAFHRARRHAHNDAANARRSIAMLRQDPFLWSRSTAETNAAIPLLPDRVSLRAARNAAQPMLEDVGLGSRLLHAAEDLSGGEQQRVALARALVADPAVLLADEPTSKLDPRTGQAVLEVIARVCRERNVAALIATHDPAVADVTDDVYELRLGQLAIRAAAVAEH